MSTMFVKHLAQHLEVLQHNCFLSTCWKITLLLSAVVGTNAATRALFTIIHTAPMVALPNIEKKSLLRLFTAQMCSEPPPSSR